MLVLMTLRCEQCGHENDARYRFCGMCGAKLPLPVRESAVPRTDPPDPEPPAARLASGPSFLGLADEPADPVSYLLEDEPAPHRGRYLIVGILLVGAAVAAWHWRQDLRPLVSRALAGRPAIQSQDNANTPAPATSSSETPAPTGTSTATLPPNSTASNSNQAPAGMPPAPQPGAPAGADQSAAGTATTIASTSNSDTPNTPAPAAVSDQPPPAAPAATDNAESAKSDSAGPADSADSKDQHGTETVPVPAQETQAVKPTPAKSKKSSVEQVPVSAGTDELETEGEKYLYGNGVPANCALAQKSLLAAAARSSGKAESVLGTMYATGHCATRDLAMSYRWFARALHQDPNNIRIEQDLKVLWNQMTPEERQVALRAER
jgi:hypothetical protein